MLQKLLIVELGANLPLFHKATYASYMTDIIRTTGGAKVT
jgi:hypothetical protein